MKKILIAIFTIAILFGCAKKDDLALGVYNGRNYQNEHFKLDIEIPEAFSYLTKEELEIVNDGLGVYEDDPEGKYYNYVLKVEHADGTQLNIAVDSNPNFSKNRDRLVDSILDFLAANGVTYKHEKSKTEVNGVEYLQLDLILPFEEVQRNLITVRNDKLINIQVNYKTYNEKTAQELLAIYE